MAVPKKNRRTEEREEMLPPTTPMCEHMRPQRNHTKTETEAKTKDMVSHTKELRMLCLRSVDKEELLYSTKPMLFALVYDQEVFLDLVLLQPNRRGR